MSDTPKHPSQKIVIHEDGVVRFQENKIVSFLLDKYKPGLNDLTVRFDGERSDFEQLMMLIGYSVSGFGDLACADRRRVAQADRRANVLLGEVKP